MRLQTSKGIYSVGENVVVEIFIENASNVGSTPFHLNYNKDVVHDFREDLAGNIARADRAWSGRVSAN